MPRELGINIDHMHIPLRRIPDHSLVVHARRCVGFDIDAQGSVHLQF